MPTPLENAIAELAAIDELAVYLGTELGAELYYARERAKQKREFEERHGIMSESIVQPSKYTAYTMTGPEKTNFLRSLVYSGSTEPLVRQTAVAVVKGLHRDAHWERLERLHRFVRDSVPYHREPVEMFYRPSETLVTGADCDDHVILFCSLAWSLRYPFIIEALGDPESPYHYTCRVGYPPNDEPTGDARTVWHSYETTVDALPGEHVLDALKRIGQ